jgi:DAK2 domain fusion protein YloV
MTAAETTPKPVPDLYSCNGPQFKQLAEAALIWLETNKELVNALNVFPIPDGDTGTNMSLTMQAALREIAPLNDRSAGRVAHALAHGALMGARGNSGVILSQIWRGFARAIDGSETIDAPLFASALREASTTAYRASVRPVEGTILTVIKDAALAAEDAATRHRELRTLLERIVSAAHNSVERTPDLLPVLKQAGVVDSGGKGLTIMLEGMLRYLRGLPLDVAVETAFRPLKLDAVGAAMETIEPGQEWEVIVDFKPRGSIDVSSMYGRLEAMGTAIQVGEGDGMYRVHIHLLKSRRYEPLEMAEDLGTITNVHMENLLAQVGEGDVEPLKLATVSAGQIGVVAVSPGDGLSRVLASLGAAAIVGGGQAQNPSTEDILRAVDDLATDHVIILPNNKNIILAANQVVSLSSKQVRVVPSRSVPQGVAALLQLLPDGDLSQVAGAMEHAITQVHTGEVTLATRTVELNGVAIRDGQHIGLSNGQIVVAGEGLESTLLALLEKMDAGSHEVLTLYRGQDISEPDADALAGQIRVRYPELNIETHFGGQPHYPFILSLE